MHFLILRLINLHRSPHEFTNGGGVYGGRFANGPVFAVFLSLAQPPICTQTSYCDYVKDYLNLFSQFKQSLTDIKLPWIKKSYLSLYAVLDVLSTILQTSLF